MSIKLPPLPSPSEHMSKWTYDEADMQAYAAQAVEAYMAERQVEAVPDAIAAAIKHAAAVLESDAGPQARKATADGIRGVLKEHRHPAPAQREPVQWQKLHPLRTDGHWENTNEHDAKWWRDNAKGWQVRALYTALQPAQQEGQCNKQN